ncbi:hypothetical protein [Actinacidiphila yeochonensis]|uniref:hypothetical protein n=1 Tax=Actinacidiphila yeochonensis TaxID=89050 RepID=UPI00068DDCEF|nr:hypothetical protein [Actinacidiphila yeochonensis]
MTTEHEGQQGAGPEPAAGGGAKRGWARPHRRRTAVVAVAAAVLAVGAGGAWWAAAAGGGGDGGAAATRDAPAPLRLDGSGGRAGADGARYRVTGTLPAGPARAAVYRTGGDVTASDVSRLAGLLKVAGPVVSDHDSWRVGGSQGGPSLLVAKAAPGTWTYSSTGAAATPVRPGAAGGTNASPGTPVSVAAAEAAAAPLLKGLGLSDARIDASGAVGGVRTVTADPRIGGLPTYDWTTSVEVGSDGRPALGFGRLSPLVKGDEYPVVSAAKAVAGLRSEPVAHPMYCMAVPASGTGSGSGSGDSCGAASGGSGQPVEVRGASFGLAARDVAGRPALVPSWLFRVAPAGSATTSVEPVTAVDPAYVAGARAGRRARRARRPRWTRAARSRRPLRRPPPTRAAPSGRPFRASRRTARAPARWRSPRTPRTAAR